MRTALKLCILALGLAAPAGSISASAQAPDTRPVTLVVPIAAGGGVDTIGRIFAAQLAERLKQPWVVENRPGAGGVLGLDSVAKAVPDGHTMVVIETSAVLQKWLHKNVPFDVVADFAPVAQMATTPLLLFANASLPVSNVTELIAYAKANPGKLSVGTPGIGSPHHLAVAMLNAAAGIDITHVPYKGTAPALNDLLGGQIPLIWATPNVVMQYVEAGKIKPLAVGSLERIATAAERADAQRERRPRLRRQRLVRHRRADEDAARHHCALQRRNRRDRQDAGDKDEDRAARLRSQLSRQPASYRQDRSRPRPLRQSDPRRRHHAGLNRQEKSPRERP